MAMPVPVAAGLDERVIEFRARKRRAEQDGVIEHHEAVELFRYFDDEIAPQVTRLTTTVTVIKSMLTSEEGCFGYRVRRSLTELWRRPSNVITFHGRDEDGGEAA